MGSHPGLLSSLQGKRRAGVACGSSFVSSSARGFGGAPLNCRPSELMASLMTPLLRPGSPAGLLCLGLVGPAWLAGERGGASSPPWRRLRRYLRSSESLSRSGGQRSGGKGKALPLSARQAPSPSSFRLQQGGRRRRGGSGEGGERGIAPGLSRQPGIGRSAYLRSKD